MEKGSLVVILPMHLTFPVPLDTPLHKVDWVPEDNGETIYTIRDFTDGGDTVLLEEHIIGYNKLTGQEIGVDLPHVIEIQKPLDLTEIYEKTNISN